MSSRRYRLDPKEAVARGFISAAEGQKIIDAMRQGRDVLGLQPAHSAAEQGQGGQLGRGNAGAASPVPVLKAKSPTYAHDSVPPQQQLYEALCERLPGLPEWEKSGLVPGRRFRADIFIPPDVVVEMDGYQHHTAKEAYQKDRKRNNLFVLHGFRVFHAFTKQVRDDEQRCELVELIASAVENPVYRFSTQF